MKRMTDNWVQLRSGLAPSQLLDGQLRLTTESGKSYCFDQRHKALLVLLHQGTSLHNLQRNTVQEPEWTRSMLMLEELQLLEYCKKGGDTFPALSARSAPNDSVLTPASLHSASAILIVLGGWQLYLLMAFFSGETVTELPRIEFRALLQSTLPTYALLGLVLWIVAHELAHAGAARWCGVRGGSIRWMALSLPKPVFNAPPQDTLNRADVRFFIFSAGPLLDLLCSLSLVLAWCLAPPIQATALKTLFILSLLIGLPNCCMLMYSDMAQGMQAFRILCRSRWPSAIYGTLSLAYAIVVVLMAVKSILLFRLSIA